MNVKREDEPGALGEAPPRTRTSLTSQTSIAASTLDGHDRVTLRPLQRSIELRFEHRIYFTENLFHQANPLLERVLRGPGSAPSPKALVILDEKLQAADPGLSGDIETCFRSFNDHVKLVRAPMVLEGGERLKNSYFHVSEIHSEIDRHNIDRHSFLVAVGGGALLDVAGLAAATAHRGIRLVRAPSTTLSQADSGVGIKNGINAFGKKNFVGTFAVPFAVINDFALLRCLPARHKRSGYSEAVKVACIQDASFFEAIEAEASALRAFEPAPMRRLIHRSAELHLNHIAGAGDPFELGSARPLDFGHWAAHKLEQLSEYRITHGEAVALGIALDTTYSRRMGFLRAPEAERILALLEELGFETYAHELCNVDSDGQLALLAGLGEFRRHLGGELTVTLLRGIGHGFESHEMDDAVIADSIRELRQRQGERGLSFDQPTVSAQSDRD